MTEQPPSAEALEIAERIRAPNGMKCAAEIDALVKQRVSVERSWWQNRERQLLEQISILRKTVQGFQRAQAERPAPEGPQRLMEGMRRGGLPDDHPLQSVPSAFASTGEQPASPAVVDYTERAREIVSDWQIQVSPEGWLDTEFDELRKLLATALSDVASERDAAAIRAFGQRVWSDSEEIAYQAGVSDTRARLREADVREAIISEAHRRGLPSAHPWVLSSIDAALTKIAEMLK